MPRPLPASIPRLCRPFRPRKTVVALVALAAAIVAAAQPLAQVAPALAVRGGPVPGPLPVFPADNWWNQDISAAPIDPGSAGFIGFIGVNRRLHPDFGGYDLDNPANIYGFPFVVVGGDQPKRAVQFYYANQSDGVTQPGNVSVPFYPIPDEAKTQSYWIEGGPPGNQEPGGDRHMLIIDKDRRHLYELFDLRWNAASAQWHAGSGAFFDLNRNDRRPETWTSADAAGLAIFPGLVRYDEVASAGEIRHAFRVTVQSTNGYVWPASHRAGSSAGALPMGARLRLKSTANLAPYPAAIQKIFRAMQRYGLIVADNGSNMYISGTFDTRWDNDVLNPAFSALKASDFEVIQLGWRGSSVPCTTPGAPTELVANVSGFVVSLSWTPPAGGGVQSYVVEAGSHLGASDVGTFTLPGTQTTFGGTVPQGTYYVRVHARNACGSAVTADAQIPVPSGCTAPGAPGQPSAIVSGTTVTLGWSPAAGASSYVLEAGSQSGAANLLRAAIHGPGIVASAPPGMYHVRVRGQNGCGVGAASPDRIVTIGNCTLPVPAGSLMSHVSGRTVTLQWAGMPGATSYRLEAGSAFGLSDILVADVPTNIVTTGAPPGEYHVRVRGRTACGLGDPTNEVTVVVR